MRRSLLFLVALAAACGDADLDGSAPPPPGGGDPPDVIDDDPVDPPLPDPVLFVHGINGSADDWAVMLERFREAGWPETHLAAHTFDDPQWGCNTDNAAALSGWIDEMLAATGAERVDVVAHSMGGLSSRWYMKELAGTDRTGTYVTLGTMHHGLSAPCWSPFDVCVWQELCESGDFLDELGAAPVTPEPAWWVSIYSDGDDTVPAESSQLDGAENIMLPGIEHAGESGLQQSEQVFDEVVRVLDYEWR
jgi:triacylglycerol lipase